MDASRFDLRVWNILRLLAFCNTPSEKIITYFSTNAILSGSILLVKMLALPWFDAFALALYSYHSIPLTYNIITWRVMVGLGLDLGWIMGMLVLIMLVWAHAITLAFHSMQISLLTYSIGTTYYIFWCFGWKDLKNIINCSLNQSISACWMITGRIQSHNISFPIHPYIFYVLSLLSWADLIKHIEN